MKNILVSAMLLTIFNQPVSQQKSSKDPPTASTENVFIITTDGYRWQEVFTGADSTLLHNEKITPGTEILQDLFWDPSPERRREKLMPFLWSNIAKNGILYGNRHFDNQVDVANSFAVSYPGYSEMLTGYADPFLSSNKKQLNPNINLLEWMNTKPSFKDKVAVFASWNHFPYILNKKRNELPINCGYANDATGENELSAALLAERFIAGEESTRDDMLTFILAKDYIVKHKPRILFLALGETDEFAHNNRYDLYLQQANKVDHMLSELWHLVQTTPGYKNNTTFIVTTDHGRGSRSSRWNAHGPWVAGSSETWIAMIGAGIPALGEVKEPQQLKQQQVAQTIAHLLGEDFQTTKPVASAILIHDEKTLLSLAGGFLK